MNDNQITSPVAADADIAATVAEPYTVLVVDDDQMIRDVVCTYLQRDGFKVHCAGGGGEAELLLATHPCDAVVSDIIMPNTDGLDLLRNLKQNYPRLPVILMTGVPSVDAAVQCVKTGAFDYVAKPFDLAHLRDTILAGIEAAENAHVAAKLDQEIRSVFAGYHLKKTLGEGNSGIVFLAETDDQRQYALKILKLRRVSEQKYERILQRFVNETRAAARIAHPNVIKFIDVGVATEEHVPYLVMEYFQGPTLAELLPLETVDLRAKVRILIQIADALAAIHGHNICHRDIKPGNIMVNREDLSVKLSDFGIALLPESSLTDTVQLMGSPAYMAPEGFRSSSVNHLADIFSLGIVAYQLLLDQRPFKGETIEQLAMQITHSKPLAPSKIDPSFPLQLQYILAKMLRKDPARRYQSADALRIDLQAFLDSQLQIRLRDRICLLLHRSWS